MIAILGPHGRLGQELVALGGTPIEGSVPSLTVLEELLNHQAIINCAAYTQVDLCEDSVVYEQAVQVNVMAVRTLGAFSNTYKIPLIHISSDYVFGGRKGPYSEASAVPDEDDLPVNRYGMTKLFGEAVACPFPLVKIVRTTGLYGGVSGKPDFLRVVLRVLESGGEFRATNDLEGNQTYVPHLAEALMLMAQELCVKPSAYPNLLHIASTEVCTRYDFARMIAEEWGYPTKQVIPVTNAGVPGWIAKRPQHGGLITKVASDLGLPIYKISEGLRHAHENWDHHTAV